MNQHIIFIGFLFLVLLAGSFLYELWEEYARGVDFFGLVMIASICYFVVATFIVN